MIMKRVNHLWEAVADPDNLRLAFWKARKDKNYSKQVQAYRQNLDDNLMNLREQISTGEVKVGEYRYFKVFEPKERNICAAAFGEQVLHHALMNVCHDFFERFQIHDSYASRKGKGTYAALARAQKFSRTYPWYLKLDVRKFFESIHHEVVKLQLRHMFKDGRLQGIFDKIIDSYEAHPGRGLPIGNLTSQYCANHYLAGLDHFIKEKLGCKGYVRYMDDMVLWWRDKAELKKAHKIIRNYVQLELLCELKPEVLNQSKFGLPFLGYRIFPYQIKLTQQSKRRFIKKFGHLEKQYHSGEWDEATCQRRVLPLLAFIRHANTEGLRKKVIFNEQGQSS